MERLVWFITESFKSRNIKFTFPNLRRPVNVYDNSWFHSCFVIYPPEKKFAISSQQCCAEKCRTKPPQWEVMNESLTKGLIGPYFRSTSSLIKRLLNLAAPQNPQTTLEGNLSNKRTVTHFQHFNLSGPQLMMALTRLVRVLFNTVLGALFKFRPRGS